MKMTDPVYNDKKYVSKEREQQLMKATVLHFIYFHRDLSTPAMSTDSSQVGVALSPSC